MEIIPELIKLEQSIEKAYILLYLLHSHKKRDSYDYNSALVELEQMINFEKHFLSKLFKEMEPTELKKIIGPKEEGSLLLGPSENIYLNRLHNLIDFMEGDDIVDYALSLKTDINRIVLAFIDILLTDTYNDNIKDILLRYKYSLMYLDLNLENDLIMNNKSSEIRLEASNYRTNALPGYIYVDKAVLILEAHILLTDIIINQDFLDNEETKALTIISIVEVLSRLMLCEDETLNIIYDDLIGLIEADSTNPELKNLIKKMLNILDYLKNNIIWAR